MEKRVLALVAYLATIVAANWLTAEFGATYRF
jgi:hypothetical protein